METKKDRAQVFLVLVPHRDVRLLLRKYSDTLFKAGFDGAYQFPYLAPLAALSRPMNSDELKQFALSIGQAAGGKINAAEGARTAFPDSGAALFGLRLNIDIAKNAPKNQKVINFFTPPVIGACLLSASDTSALPPPPELSFRAAAVANMYWRPVKTDAAVIGYKWKIGNLRWLAAAKKKG